MRVTSCVVNKRPNNALEEKRHIDILISLSASNRRFLMNSIRYLLYYFDNKEANANDFLKEMELLSVLANGRGVLQEFQIFFWDLMTWQNNYGRTEKLYLELEEN